MRHFSVAAPSSPSGGTCSRCLRVSGSEARAGAAPDWAFGVYYRPRACQTSAASTTSTPTNAEYASTLSRRPGEAAFYRAQ